jgi:hypothetical protein
MNYRYHERRRRDGPFFIFLIVFSVVLVGGGLLAPIMWDYISAVTSIPIPSLPRAKGPSNAASGAAPIKLVCDVKVTPLRDPSRTDRETLTLVMDYSAKRVTLNGAVYGEVQTPISKMDEDTIEFEPKDFPYLKDPHFIGLRDGSLNRFSGQLYMHYQTLTDGTYVYEGFCKPGQKLF